MKKVIGILLVLGGLSFSANAQPNPQGHAGGYHLPVIIKGQDTLPVYVVPETDVEQAPDPEMLQKQKDWNRLLYNVRKVYPYAIACSMKIREIDSQLASMDRRRDKKEFMRSEEDKLKAEFKDKLENLSENQGRILIKLVDRQTGHTSYSLIKEYKNGISAMMWQGVAGVFGMNLNEKYDPKQEQQIEAAIKYLGLE